MSTVNIYFWSGLDKHGQRVQGCDQARSKTVLKYTLLTEDVMVSKISKKNTQFIAVQQWLNSKQTLLYLSQLAAILKTGINLNRACDILNANQTSRLLTRLHSDVRRRLGRGQSLSQAIENYPMLFDNVIAQILKSGELTGRIDRAAQQAADYFEAKMKTVNDLLTAMLYPLMLVLVSLGVLTVMIIYIIPQFQTIYAQTNNPLPFLTRMVLSLSEQLTSKAGTWLTVFSVCGLLVYLLNKSTRFRLLSLIPGLDLTLKKINTLKLSKTLHELYSSGIALSDALLICTELSGDRAYRNALTRVTHSLNQGHELAVSLQKSQYFDALFVQLIKTGEESACLNDMLEQCVNYYQKQLNNNLTRLKIILEPLLILLLASLIGVILLAMYLPVFNLGVNF